MSKTLWVGVDEAGLGPVLGPLCLSAVCSSDFQSPGELQDSKALYAGKNLKRLIGSLEEHLGTLDQSRLQSNHIDLPSPSEPWFSQHEEGVFSLEGARGHQAWSLSIGVEALNRSFDSTGNKSTTQIYFLGLLIKAVLEDRREQRVEFLVDRLGGRKRYAEVLEEWGFRVQSKRESTQSSSYGTDFEGRQVHFNFEVKADAHYPVVSLASCLSKLRREWAMSAFNTWWREKCPYVKPTAGYWEDGLRFLSEIENVRGDSKIDLLNLKRQK